MPVYKWSFFPTSSLDQKNNLRNIKYMTPIDFLVRLDHGKIPHFWTGTRLTFHFNPGLFLVKFNESAMIFITQAVDFERLHDLHHAGG